MEITATTTPARHYVGVRRTVKVQEIKDVCGEVLPRVWQWLQERGVAPASPPMMVYHAHHAEQGEFDLQPGFFVPAPMDPDGDITPGVTASGDVATAIHAGPYEGLGETWGRVFAWVAAQGRTVTEASWEIYVTDPGEHPDPADWRTEIVVPMAP